MKKKKKKKKKNKKIKKKKKKKKKKKIAMNVRKCDKKMPKNNLEIRAPLEKIRPT